MHFDLGKHSRRISTTSPKAQHWFDLGLRWCFGFNLEEGVKCFLKALTHDPHCVMAHWGVAFGSGPFYNLTWREMGRDEAARSTAAGYRHLAKARGLADRASEDENDLVQALSMRFQGPDPVSIEEFERWDTDYANQLRRLYYLYPEDLDIAALFADALITRTPRRLWNLKTGAPEKNADVVEALQVCERALAKIKNEGAEQHPAIVHMHIHILEMSKEPERAMASADALATLCPDAGHMNHMPAHIYVLCGQYDRAKSVSERAIKANDRYEEYAGALNFYTAARCHDLHLMCLTCMFLGQYGPALAAADKLRRTITREILALSDRPKLVMTLEAYFSVRLHVMVRFGKWREIIDEPLTNDPDTFYVTTAIQHYARAIAFATLKHVSESEEERRLFHLGVERIPAGRRFANNDARDVLAVARMMMEGEVEYHKANFDVAFDCLREAVRLDDGLNYHEPWAWMHPPRHALGALLLEQGFCEEAEAVYRSDLGLNDEIQRCAQHPNNVWALHGIVECLTRRNDKEFLALFQDKLAHALHKTDLPIASSCMCRSHVFTPSSCCSGDIAGPELQ